MRPLDIIKVIVGLTLAGLAASKPVLPRASTPSTANKIIPPWDLAKLPQCKTTTEGTGYDEPTLPTNVQVFNKRAKTLSSNQTLAIRNGGGRKGKRINGFMKRIGTKHHCYAASGDSIDIKSTVNGKTWPAYQLDERYIKRACPCGLSRNGDNAYGIVAVESTKEQMPWLVKYAFSTQPQANARESAFCIWDEEAVDRESGICACNLMPVYERWEKSITDVISFWECARDPGVLQSQIKELGEEYLVPGGEPFAEHYVNPPPEDEEDT